MSQVSSVLRRYADGYAHWCPGCLEMHVLPDGGWKFDGNLECPTFDPSFKHEFTRCEYVNGKWTGEWIRDAQGKTIPATCHYNLIAGQLHFHVDCTHALKNKVVPLPKLPEGLTDE